MRKLFERKRRLVVALSVLALAIGAAGASFAYFTTTGTGTGSGSVGTTSSAADWGVTFGAGTYSGGATAIYPGITESIPVTITNNAKGNEGLTSVVVALKTNGSDVATSAGADIAGCLSAWWTVNVTQNFTTVPNFAADGNADDVAAAGTDAETVSLTLNDSGTNQDVCESSAPGFTVTAG